ncbi:MAG: hypothetical protein AB7T49_02355 [Oligoflexales bacterium]
MVKHSKSPVFASATRMQSRLSVSPSCFPLVSAISFGLFVLCCTYVLPSVTYKMYSMADRPVVAAKPTPEGPIYISLAPYKDKVVVTVNQKNFHMNSEKATSKDMEQLVSFLKEKTREQMIKVGLELQIDPQRTEAVLAVDRRLKYIHVQPIIAALAQAKIYRYGFETIILE